MTPKAMARSVDARLRFHDLVGWSANIRKRNPSRRAEIAPSGYVRKTAITRRFPTTTNNTETLRSSS
jgi:hypothetical protein